MATKSIEKDIKISNRKQARNFLHALESSQKFKAPKVELKKACRDLSKDEIQKIFGEKNK